MRPTSVGAELGTHRIWSRGRPDEPLTSEQHHGETACARVAYNDDATRSGRNAVVVFDLDGTLSSAEWRRPIAESHRIGFFQLLRYDAPAPKTLSLLRTYVGAAEIVLLSSRPSWFDALTREWLSVNRIPFSRLILRRDDAVTQVDFKVTEIRELQAAFTIVCVFDDNAEVISAVRNLGVRAELVADPCLPPRDWPGGISTPGRDAG